MKPNKTILLFLALSLLCGLVGCRSNEGDAAYMGPPPPDWWHNPRQDDTQHVFVKGNAKKCDTEQQARDRAYANALGMLSKRLLSHVTVNGSEVEINSNYALRDTRIFTEDTMPDKGKWYSWVQVTYPQTEKKKLLDRLDKTSRNIKDIKQRTKSLSNDFKISLKTKSGKNSFRDGEKVSFVLTSPKDCHVAVFCHQSNGESIMLFPNAWSANTKIYANRPVEIPGAVKSDFEIVIGPPYGTDIVQAIACTDYSLLHKRLQHMAKKSSGYSGVSRGMFAQGIKESVSAYKGVDQPPAWGESSISVSTYGK